jgi:hypothetical protein
MAADHQNAEEYSIIGGVVRNGKIYRCCMQALQKRRHEVIFKG